MTDEVMMPKQDLCTGFVYEHDRWSNYWEGTLKRDNQNIGAVTTQAVNWMGVYGITDRINAIAMVPYVWTSASQGTLRGMSGLQDLTVALKYNFLSTALGPNGAFKAFAVGTYGTPLTDYTPDFLPLSIGMASPSFSGRATLNYTARNGLYINASGAYTWRGNVTLDRPAYFTDGALYLSDQVKMPGAVDFVMSVGYVKGRLQVPISFSSRNTQGGGDIRRQDMPFVSNRMDLSRLDATVMYYLGRPKDLALRGAVAYTLDGRNVSQSTTFLAGFLYTFHF
jgi:hypothetical protein